MDKDMLANELYLMDKGVRDCCELTIGGTPKEIGDKLYDIESMCLDYKYHVVSFLLEKEEDREYRSVFICKYNYQKIMLTKLFNDIKPHSFVYEYILGSLLGYSAASMEEFLMRKCTNELTSIMEYNKEEESPIKDQLSEFDKDAWQVLMSLNDNCAPDSEKMNTLTDLLYTDTDDSREKHLVHELSTAISLIDVNDPNFSLCIKILEKYFHVDTEDVVEDKEETDTPADETTEEKLDVEQYFERVADLYTYLNVPTFSVESELAHIKKFIDITPPSYIPEQILHSKIKYDYYKLTSQEEKIEAVKDALHTYLLCKRESMDDEIETDNKGNTNESIDPYKQLVNKLYNDLIKNATTEDRFVSILSKFLEKEPCYKEDKEFQKSLRCQIEKEYGRTPKFSSNVLDKIKMYLDK